MKVLVTGADGFLGSALIRHLIDAGHLVRGLIHKDKSRDTLEGLEVERVKGDVRDIEAVDTAVKGCEIVFHLGSLYKFYPWWKGYVDEIFDINVIGTKNVLNSSLKHNVKRFIYTSSIASIGKRADNLPGNEDTEFNLWFTGSQYAHSKVEAEKEVLKACKKGLSAVILNPAAIIGQRDYKPTNTGETIVKFLNRQYAGYFDCALSLADVDDVARAHLAAIDRGRVGQRYILCDSKLYTLVELYGILEKVSGIKAPERRMPYFLMLVILYIDEVLSYFILKKKPLLSVQTARLSHLALAYDNSKAKKELGYAATPMEETFKKAVIWYKENGYVKSS